MQVTLRLKRGDISITDGGVISNGTGGRGRGGDVRVSAEGMITMSGVRTGITTSTTAAGRGGDIWVRAETIELTNDMRIETESFETGNAGNIHLVATDTLTFRNASTITTNARQSDGGDITVSARALVQLQDSTITATVDGGLDTIGGNIDVTSDVVLLLDSDVRADAFKGRGGRVTIEATALFQDPESRVSASSELGLDGTVAINTIVSDLKALVRLPDTFAATDRLQDRCTLPLQAGVVSRFFVRQNTGIPAAPGGLLPGLIEPVLSALIPDAQAAEQASRIGSLPSWNEPARWMALEVSPHICSTP